MNNACKCGEKFWSQIHNPHTPLPYSWHEFEPGAKKMSYDEKCLELAEYFYPRADAAKLAELAQRIQDAVEAEDLESPAPPSKEREP